MAYFHQNLRYHEDTKAKRNITKEDIEFLKELQKERIRKIIAVLLM